MHSLEQPTLQSLSARSDSLLWLDSPAYYDTERISERARLQWQHSNYREGITRQLDAIVAAEDRTPALRCTSGPSTLILRSA